MSADFVIVAPHMQKAGGNPNHDPHTGEFSSGGRGNGGQSNSAPEPKAFKGRKIVDSFTTRDGTQSYSLQAPDQEPNAGWAIYQHSKYTSGSKKGKRYDTLFARNARQSGEEDMRKQFGDLKKYHAPSPQKAASHFVIVSPHYTKGLDSSAGRFITVSGRHVFVANPNPVSMKDAASVQQAADERGKSRVLEFGQDEGSILEKNVRMVTNTSKEGQNKDGTLRVEISNADSRHLYERPMSQLPQLIAQLAAKRYTLSTQYYRSLKNVVKGDFRRILPNPMHTATLQQIERCKTALATIQAKDLKDAPLLSVSLDDLISIQPTIDDDKVSQMVEAGLAKLKGAPEGLGLRYGKQIFLVDGNHRAIAFGRLGETEMSLRVISSSAMKAASHFVIIHPMKAEGQGKWVTLPNGARIQIRGDTGGAQAQTQAKPQEKPPTKESQPTAKESESQGNAGEGLTHQQMTTIAQKVASKLGVNADSITVAEKDEAGEDGAKAGEYDPDTQKITLYPESFARGKDELVGTIVHEASHMQLDKVLKAYNEQQKQFQSGASLTSGKIDVYKELKPAFAKDERITYERADGINKYSTMFWDRYKVNPTTQTYVHAINETLAETARLTQAGKGSDIHPQITALYNRVNRLAKGLTK